MPSLPSATDSPHLNGQHTSLPLTPRERQSAPIDDFLRALLARPELAPVPESCKAEQALYAALQDKPLLPVAQDLLQTLEDEDVRENYRLFLRCRDGLLEARTLENYYVQLFRDGVPAAGRGVAVPPLFIDLLVEAIVLGLLADNSDAYEARAADMLFRAQRISTTGGQLLGGDQETLDMFNETGGLGDFGRFLAESKAPLRSIELKVLSDDNAAQFFASRQPDGRPAARHAFLLDLTHEVSNDLSHGLVLTMTRARSGLKALASVLQRWVHHFLGVEVTVRPLQKIDDLAWRWHVGLDAEATALLNDLYEGREVEPARLQRLVSLFRLDFVDPRDMREDVRGSPVYLALMMNADGVVKLKPQNLLINLPLREPV